MKYRVTVILIALIILISYLYFSKPDTVVVDEKGKIDGFVNKGRSLLQRDKFWKLQLKMATELYNKSIAPHPPTSSEMQELYRKLREDQRLLDDRMKTLYTPEEQMANLLRLKADSIERAGKWRLLNQTDDTLRFKDAEKFKLIIPIIESKLHIPKPPSIPVK